MKRQIMEEQQERAINIFKDSWKVKNDEKWLKALRFGTEKVIISDVGGSFGGVHGAEAKF